MADGQMTQSTYLDIDGLPARVTALENVLPVQAAVDAKQDAALAEVIDKGKKNIIDSASDTFSQNGVLFWNCHNGEWIVNGTASSRAMCPIIFTVPASLPAGRYVISGCPAGGKEGSTIKYCLYLYDLTSSARVTASNDDTGDGFAFDWTPDASHTYQLNIDIRSGTTVSNLVFRPMICSEKEWNESKRFAPFRAEKRSPVTINIKSSNVIDGYWVKATDGSIQTGNFKYTEDIDVEGFSKIGISCGVGQFAFYDKDKTYVSGVSVSTTDAHDYAEYDIPNKAKYVRCTVGSSAVGKGFITFNNGEQMFSPVVVSATKYGGQFRKLRDGIAYAVRFENAKVIVKQGTYDLVSEFSSEITNVGSTEFGIALKNGVHVIFSPQSLVTALYTGSNTSIPQYFAPFRVESGGNDSFILENLTIQSQNTRYCVHDELEGKSTTFTRHIFRNCRMEHDSVTVALTGNGYVQCIGGGCGRQTYVEIVGCEFKSKRAETSNTPLVSYHNAINASGETHDGKSSIYIRNCYFHDKGYVRCTYYGATTAISKMVITGNSFGAEPVIKYEVDGATTPQNFELIQWLNEVRT